MVLYLIGILDNTSRCSIKLVNLLSVSVFSLSVRVREGMILSLIQSGRREYEPVTSTSTADCRPNTGKLTGRVSCLG